MKQFAKTVSQKLLCLFVLFGTMNLSAQTVYDVVVNSDDHTTLETAIDAAQLDGALSDGSASLTLFAPTDAAFAALGDVVNDLLMDPTGDLADILRYHVLTSEVPASGVTNGLTATPLNDANTIKFTVTTAGGVFANQASVTMTDIPASNGVVHVIDAVIVPNETVVDVAIDNGFTTLTAAVTAAELLPALTDPAGTYTVFAPTDEAFGALGETVNDLLADPTGDLQDILLYHVLGAEVAAADVTNGQIADALSTTNTLKLTKTSMDEVFVNQAQVTTPDVAGGNGIVHIIDQVVLPGETVVDVAIDNGFSTLTTAVVAAELLPALTDPAGTYTVFAPTEDAFGALGETVNDLLADPTGDLQDILLYHVLGSEVAAADVTNGLIADALSATNTLKFTKTTMDEVFVNQAQVTMPDIAGGNGVVHVIDQVVLPVETLADLAIDLGFNTLVTAGVAAELLPVLTDPAGDFTVFAPTDAAFAELGSTLDDLLADPTGDLRDIILYHVLSGRVNAASITNGQIAEPVNTANTLKLTRAGGGGIFVNHATVLLPDGGATNGIAHAINKVLLPTETVVDVAIDNGFNTLVTAVAAAELLPALTDPAGTFTVFAPTDAAFEAAVGEEGLAELLEEPTGLLQDILLYHVLDAEVAAADVTNGLIADALSPTNTLKFTKTGMDEVFVNQAQVTTPDVPSGNGVVHIIDDVVVPFETVVDVAIDNEFTTLTTAVVAAELLPALTDPAAEYTVFAPTNDAFAALGETVNDLLADPTGDLQNILLYHVLGVDVAADEIENGTVIDALSPTNTLKLTKTEGGDVFVNQAQVAMADIFAFNGTVHVIDQVVLPVETVVDVAIDNEFNTLTTAVAAAELLPALTDPAGTFTVFAPTDEAFGELSDAINDLLADPTGDLRNILLGHVLGATVTSDQLENGQQAETLLPGAFITVDLTDSVRINNATVTTPDVPADNGVVHIIDAVLEVVVNVDEQILQDTQIYPNPTADFINVNAVEEDYEFAIFDLTGKAVLNGYLNQGDNRIDLATLSTGIYLMKINDGERFATARIVVNK